MSRNCAVRRELIDDTQEAIARLWNRLGRESFRLEPQRLDLTAAEYLVNLLGGDWHVLA
jgi:hypothetical protein